LKQLKTNLCIRLGAKALTKALVKDQAKARAKVFVKAPRPWKAFNGP